MLRVVLCAGELSLDVLARGMCKSKLLLHREKAFPDNRAAGDIIP